MDKNYVINNQLPLLADQDVSNPYCGMKPVANLQKDLAPVHPQVTTP